VKRIAASFSALQRAEIAEISTSAFTASSAVSVSVLFNEPKLLKCARSQAELLKQYRFSALQRAEIAEIVVESGLA